MRTRGQPDREKRASRPPLDLRERGRLALKFAVPVLAFSWFDARPVEDSGPALVVAFAGGAGAISLIELAFLTTSTQAERIFTRSRRQATILNAAVVVAAAAAILVAAPRLT
ncbi:MAG: hypothetical protein M3273_05005 [Actinomycetota bacterium]|nr:hypothetical protein [Actinomycetota bacterium]